MNTALLELTLVNINMWILIFMPMVLAKLLNSFKENKK